MGREIHHGSRGNKGGDTDANTPHKFWDYLVPMLAGDHVTDDAGTGLSILHRPMARMITNCLSNTTG